MNQFDYHSIDHLMPSLRRYIDLHCPPGGFLHAVLSNDLKEAIARADEQNMGLLPILATWLYNEAPGGCWGSAERVRNWLNSAAD